MTDVERLEYSAWVQWGKRRIGSIEAYAEDDGWRVTEWDGRCHQQRGVCLDSAEALVIVDKWLEEK